MAGCGHRVAAPDWLQHGRWRSGGRQRMLAQLFARALAYRHPPPPPAKGWKQDLGAGRASPEARARTAAAGGKGQSLNKGRVR